MGDNRSGIFLKIVGRKVVFFRRNEAFEISPRPARGQPE